MISDTNEEMSDDMRLEEIDDLLERGVQNAPSLTVSSDVSQIETRTQQDVDNFINTINGKILLNHLTPQVEKNEEKKREHKDKLIKYVSIFLGMQFCVIFILVLLIIVPMIIFHAKGNDFSFDLVKMLFAFFSSYITSVIVELICILKYIVVNVFDTSISSLMEIFRSGEKGNTE